MATACGSKPTMRTSSSRAARMASVSSATEAEVGTPSMPALIRSRASSGSRKKSPDRWAFA